MIKESYVNLLEASIRKNWDLPALSNYKTETIKYSELAEKILFAQHLFKRAGVKNDDKIAILGKNSINWGITYLATISFPAVAVPILPDFKADDVHHIICHSGSTILFVAEALYENLDENSMPDVDLIISLNDFSTLFSRKKLKTFDMEKERNNFLNKEKIKINSTDFKLGKVKNDKLAAIIYTSGTTGFSKGVMLGHNSISANIVFAREKMALKSGDAIVSFLPIAHVFGCAFEFLFPITKGCHITFLSKIPSPKIIMKAFQEIHPRLILSVPLVIEKIYRKQLKPVIQKPVMKILLKLPLISTKIKQKINNKLTDVFGGNFMEIVIGGAALNKEVEDFLRKINFRYTIGYGMTECGPLISYENWKNFKKNSTGKIVTSLDIKIDSEDPYNIVGEIMVKGDNIMMGYYKNKEATDNSITKDKWLRTGDLGIIDKDNTIFIKGRSKNMILGPSGKNIYPEELESKLNNLPFVQESIIIEKNGQLIALVYPDMEAVDTQKLNENQLQSKLEENRKLLNNHFPSYIHVSKIKIYAQEFEKTPKKSIKRYLYYNN